MTAEVGAKLLAGVPDELRDALLKHHREIHNYYLTGKFEPSELNAAKFCEVMLRVLQFLTSDDGTYPPLSDGIKNVVQALRNFENMSSQHDTLRFHIPRVLNSVYNIRSKRAVAHVAGDIDPNHMDATYVLAACDWVMAELVRLRHNVPLEEAERVVEALTQRVFPLVWMVREDRLRVLDASMSYRDCTLLLLWTRYPQRVSDKDLGLWTEHSNYSVYKSQVLSRLHNERLIDYDGKSGEVVISPAGMNYVKGLLARHAREQVDGP